MIDGENVQVNLGKARNRESLLEWAMEWYQINGEPLSLSEHPYMIDILLCDHPIQVMKKSAQVGVSEYCVMLSIYVSSVIGGTGLYLFPTKGHVSDFVRQRFDPIVDGSPKLRSISRRPNTRGGDVYNVGLKKMGDGFIFFRGTKSKHDLISIPADLLIVDELDECVVSNVPLALERLAASDLNWIRYVSTPWFPGGPIDKEYKRSDARKWMLTCQGCNQKQTIDWHKNVVREVDADQYGVTYLPRDPECTPEVARGLAGDMWRDVAAALPFDDLRPVCQKCKKPMNRLAMGEWVPENPGRSVVGWHISRLNSPRKRIAELYHDFMAAQTSVNKLAIFYRMALGLGYDVVGDGLSRATLTMVAQEYEPGEVDGDYTTAGVDVGAMIHVQVSRMRGKQRVALHHHAVRDFKDVARILDLHKVDCCVVDALPETREVKRFRDEQPHGRIYLATFGLNCEGQARDESDWLRFDHLQCHIKCDRTMVIDEALGDLVAEDPKFIFPARWLDNEEWVQHMCAPRRRTVETASGKTRAVWDEGEDDDHYRFADVYDYLAMKAVPARKGKNARADVITEKLPGARKTGKDVFSDLDGVPPDTIIPKNLSVEDAEIVKRLVMGKVNMMQKGGRNA
jgi:hypothetical protein